MNDLFTGTTLNNQDREALKRFHPDNIRDPGITDDGRIGEQPITFIWLPANDKVYSAKGRRSSHAGLQEDIPEINQIAFCSPELQARVIAEPHRSRELLDQVAITGRIGYWQYANGKRFHVIALWESPLLEQMLSRLVNKLHELDIEPYFVVVPYQPAEPATVAEILQRK